MTVFQHDLLAKHVVPRITTRVLAGSDSGALATAVWEQWMAPGGFIPSHYHEVEEVLVILSGQVEVTIGSEKQAAHGPATILIAAGIIHDLRQVGEGETHLLAFFPTATPTILAPDGSMRPMPWQDRSSAP